MSRLFVYTLVLIIGCAEACAHSGRTDSSGGHYNRRTGSYHSHGGGSSSSMTRVTPRTAARIAAAATSRTRSRTTSKRRRAEDGTTTPDRTRGASQDVARIFNAADAARVDEQPKPRQKKTRNPKQIRFQILGSRKSALNRVVVSLLLRLPGTELPTKEKLKEIAIDSWVQDKAKPATDYDVHFFLPRMDQSRNPWAVAEKRGQDVSIKSIDNDLLPVGLRKN